MRQALLDVRFARGIVLGALAWLALDWLTTVRLERLADGRPLGVVSLATVAVAGLAVLGAVRDRDTAVGAAWVLVGAVLAGLVVVAVGDDWAAAVDPEFPADARLFLERGALCPANQILAGGVAVVSRTLRRRQSIFRP